MTVNVLIVDDSMTMRQFVRRALDVSGVPIGRSFQASDGDAALAVLDAEPIDLLITDLNMPVLDGMGLLKAIRQRGLGATLRCLVVTAESPSRLGGLSDPGPIRYLRKPFTPEQFSAAVRRVLEGRP